MLHALFVGLALLATPPAEAAPPTLTLTLEQALAHPRPGLAAARLAADFAELESQLGQTRGLLREGPSLTTQSGWRRQPQDGDGTDFGLEIELPLASKASRSGRTAVAESLAASRSMLDQRARLTDRQMIVEAYLATWAAQQRLALRRADELQLRGFADRLNQQIAVGAVAAFQAGLVDAEFRAALGLAAEAEAEVKRAWSILLGLSELPVAPIPDLERPSFTAQSAAGAALLATESLLAEQRLADARSRWTESLALSRSGVAASLAREGDEDVVLLGWRWRIPFSGEDQAIQSRTTSELALREAVTRQQLAEAEARRLGSRALLAALPEQAVDPNQLDAVWRAAELRVREGKDSPAEAMNIRRALISAQLTALDLELRRLTAQAELAYLTQETRP